MLTMYNKVSRNNRSVFTRSITIGRISELSVESRPSAMDCGGMPPLWLHDGRVNRPRTFPCPRPLHRVGKAGTCPRSPRISRLLTDNSQMRPSLFSRRREEAAPASIGAASAVSSHPRELPGKPKPSGFGAGLLAVIAPCHACASRMGPRRRWYSHHAQGRVPQLCRAVDTDHDDPFAVKGNGHSP